MAQTARRVAVPARVTEYWQASRAPRYSVLLAMPLLFAYEALAAFLSTGQRAELRNGADVLLRDLFLTVAGQRYAPLALGVSVVGVSVWYIARDPRGSRAPLRGWVFAAMLGEAGIFALCFGTVIGSLTSHLLGIVGSGSAADLLVGPATDHGVSISGWAAAHDWSAFALVGPSSDAIANAPVATKVMLALGAGIYEELVFRVLLVSAIAFIARRIFRWRPVVAALAAVVLSAVIFAAFHYVGPYGDPLRLDSFVFRFIGGLAFSVLYVTRGFGITAWTHTLYDLLVLVA
jgi:Na+-translocating ferredoxin:NAD+ oxidoreductase RnfD subunit